MNLLEMKYWYFTRKLQLLRPWLAKFYPKWMVTDALLHAGVRKIRKHETVPEVPFTVVYERWYKEGREEPK